MDIACLFAVKWNEQQLDASQAATTSTEGNNIANNMRNNRANTTDSTKR